jgi:hypothetical protein
MLVEKWVLHHSSFAAFLIDPIAFNVVSLGSRHSESSVERVASERAGGGPSGTTIA